MSTEETAAVVGELHRCGLAVLRGACDGTIADVCHDDVTRSFDQMLSLPQTMAEASRPNGRQFLTFATFRDHRTPAAPGHRRDYVLPIAGSVEAVLRAALCGPAGAVLADALGADAELCGANAIAAEPGAAAQAVHSDGEWAEVAPRVITMFLALHDVVQKDMGATLFFPATHTPQCFPGRRWHAPTEAIVAQRSDQPLWFALHAGDAVLMDSRLWHAGGANTSSRRRTLLSVSFVEQRSSRQCSAEAQSKQLTLADFMPVTKHAGGTPVMQ